MKKEKTIMLRVDEELYNSFKNFVEIRRTTMSHELRQYMITKLLEENELPKNIQ